MSKGLYRAIAILLMIGLCATIPYRVKFNKPIQQRLHHDLIVDEKVIGVNANTTKTSNTLWPMPKSIQSNPQAQPLAISPCKVQYKVSAPSSQLVQQVINIYLIQIFKCAQQPLSNITLLVNVKNTDQMIATNVTQEKYTLIIRQSNKWELNADYYPGFLRGFETFSQIFEQRLNKDNQTELIIKNIPIVIDDQPDYLWRGLMIDSSRHFLPVASIKKMIDALMFNKMNVLHWHITDQDSFPMEVASVPQLSQYGSVAGTYSQKDVRSLIQYAKTRGVRLIPQIDTPAHTQAWGRGPNLTDIVVNCNTEYRGQFDPTQNKTYDVVKKVMQYVNATFSDNYVHFGGDQITMSCWDNKPQIKTRMKQLNITDYKALEIYYRQQQKKIWRQITPSKKAIYWANQQIDLPLENDDVIQWWGVSQNVNHLKGRTNQVILSNYDLTYLDIGFGNRYGGNYGYYQNWRSVYKNFTAKIQGVNVIGAEMCMWAELVNPTNIETKVWIRTSAMAQKLWNSNISIDNSLANIATRLYAQSERLRARGIKVSPVTVGLCQKDMSICFG